MVKANLTWSAAAKFYIWLVGLIVVYTTAQSDLPDWVPAVVGVLTLVAGWVKKQQPVEAPSG